jgi:hypothetical protein
MPDSFIMSVNQFLSSVTFIIDNYANDESIACCFIEFRGFDSAYIGRFHPPVPTTTAVRKDTLRKRLRSGFCAMMLGLEAVFQIHVYGFTNNHEIVRTEHGQYSIIDNQWHDIDVLLEDTETTDTVN